MNMTKKIEFTKDAIQQIEKIVTNNSPNKYFRISVKGGGCSGFKYSFTFEDKQEKDDILFNKTIIDKESLDILKGSIVDFKKELIGDFFIIKNSKAKD